MWHGGGSGCGYSVVMGSGIWVNGWQRHGGFVGGSGLMGGSNGMVGVGIKAHLSHALNFKAIPCIKTYFWWWC